ncbi:MAG: glutathione S-transferase family protein [Solirubrobacterales bacterium]
MIRLYRAHWSTNCERVALALAHKGVEVESVLIEYADRSPVERVSGQGLVPVIVDGGEVIYDSTRILRHLEQRFPDPPLFPADPARRAELDVFLEWFNEVWKSAPNALEEELEKTDPDEAAIEPLSARIAESLDLFERLLAGREYLMGDKLSAGDCAAFPFLKYATIRDPKDTELFHVMLDDHLDLGDERPRLAEWIDRVDALPRAYGPTVAE